MRNAVMLAGLIALTGAAMYVTGVWRLLLPARVGDNQAAEVPRTPVPAKPAEFEVHSEPELSKATRTLLYEARYEELERHLGQLRQDTLRDPANEYRLTQA